MGFWVKILILWINVFIIYVFTQTYPLLYLIIPFAIIIPIKLRHKLRDPNGRFILNYDNLWSSLRYIKITEKYIIVGIIGLMFAVFIISQTYLMSNSILQRKLEVAFNQDEVAHITIGTRNKNLANLEYSEFLEIASYVRENSKIIINSNGLELKKFENYARGMVSVFKNFSYSPELDGIDYDEHIPIDLEFLTEQKLDLLSSLPNYHGPTEYRDNLRLLIGSNYLYGNYSLESITSFTPLNGTNAKDVPINASLTANLFEYRGDTEYLRSNELTGELFESLTKGMGLLLTPDVFFDVFNTLTNEEEVTINFQIFWRLQS